MAIAKRFALHKNAKNEVMHQKSNKLSAMMQQDKIALHQ